MEPLSCPVENHAWNPCLLKRDELNGWNVSMYNPCVWSFSISFIRSCHFLMGFLKLNIYVDDQSHMGAQHLRKGRR